MMRRLVSTGTRLTAPMLVLAGFLSSTLVPLEAHAISGTLTFNAPVSFAVGAGARGLAFADLSRNGKTDLVTTNQIAGTVSVLMNNGDGTFQPHVDYQVGSSPYAVAIADLDRNGTFDLAVVNSVSSSISILFGNGDGTFRTPASTIALPSGTEPRGITIKDLNNDGIPDLLVAEHAAGNGPVVVLFGNGDGTYQPQHALIGGAGGQQVVTGNFDGAGQMGVATGGQQLISTMWVWSAVAGQQQFLQRGPSAYGMAVGDINRDGKPDIVMTSAPLISVYTNTTSAPPAVTFSRVDYSTGASTPTYGIALADLNGDHNLDVAATNPGANNIAILTGNDDGTLASPVTFNVGTGPRNIIAADLNGDGYPDLATANFGDSTVSVLLNTTKSVPTKTLCLT